MQSVEHELETLEAAIEENSERMKVMREHLKNVQQEIKYTETHLKIMAEKEAVSCRRSSCLFPPARPGRL